MNKTTIALLVAGLFAVPSVMAQMAVTGSVSATGISTDLSKERNAYRFDEYKDMSNGGWFGLDLRGEGKDYFMQFFGENLGRDDQFLELKGGKYGFYKYSLYGNDVIHNLTHNALTPFSGVGSNTLTFPGALIANTLTLPTNTATWTNFDYKVQHENWGGTFEMSSAPNSPFYFRVTGNEKRTKGLRPVGNAGTSPGGPFYEMPMPVDFTTTDASAEVGYATKTSQYSLNASWSRFRDHNDYLFWRNPVINDPASGTTTERTTIAADNKMWKIGANAIWKQLPMGSTLALRGTYSKLTNDLPVPLTGTAVVGLAAPTRNIGDIVNNNSNSATFNGEIIKKTFSASLTSQWGRQLDSRIYWNWEKKENNSTHLTFTPVNTRTGAGTQGCNLDLTTGVISGTVCSNELFHYKKDNLGIDLQFRMNPQNRISGGWDYSDTERERIDFDRTKDNKVYVEWRNSSFDMVTGRIKYQRLHRRSDFLLADLPLVGTPATAGNTNNLFFNRVLRRFDLNDNDQDLLKLSLDVTPVQFLDLGAEFIYKNNDYKNVALGRTKDRREEIYLTGSYGDPSKFRITAFFDYERTQYDSTHWVGNANPATFPAAVSATQYLWTGKVKDKNYVVGLAADWPYSERLRFKGSLTWQDTDGTVDLQANTVTVPPILSVTSPPGYDSFKRTTLHLSGMYSFSKEWDLQVGYAHDRFRYNDVQVDGYLYTFGVGPNTNFLSGAYAFQNYTANTVYATVRYHLR